jgi:hypothetical protein
VSLTYTDISPEAVHRLLPSRIAGRINFDGPLPPDPLRPISTPCWTWGGWCNDAGYGYSRWEGRDQPVHRIVHTALTGEDLTDRERDHVCRVPACVRPDHGEAVDHPENMARLREHQKACRKAGHDWSDPRNVRTRPDGSRYCAECDRIAQAARNKEEAAVRGRIAQKARETCPKGHEYIGDNLIIATYPDGRFRQRVCRACKTTRNAARSRKGLACP